MTRTENLLLHLMEECNELSQRVSKAMRFGLEKKQEGHCWSNAYRMLMELNDLRAVVIELEVAGILPVEELLTRLQIQAKRDKIAKYLSYSRELGTVTD